METYEKLGAFYLGKRFDLNTKQRQPDMVLYDSKDLTTHGVIIGMTGSGKTGLGVGLLEEAIIDQIPVIAIDPKGDLPNLLLTFPELAAQDFEPWINTSEALNKGQTPQQFADQQAKQWRDGLAQWGQGPERIQRLKDAGEFCVYTPGSNAGRPVSLLRTFTAPTAAAREDTDLFRECIQTTATGLLALLGLEVDPITSREHILISNIFETAWSEGRSLDLAGLIQAIQEPPFTRIGVMDLEMFYPGRDRFQLAMRINNLLAAPGFEVWMEGDPLNLSQILYTAAGKPRVSVFTISHLSDAERMFFVSQLLNEVLGWLRTQPGTSSLRALLYMDEVFGYFPPVKNPPSKAPLMRLLKQARAFGLGVVLSTQNPVDLDYRGLSNTGTWLIGRLQTQQDKDRVLAGLEGVDGGKGFNRKRMEEILSGLGKRVFLLHNVHENEPVVFQTRWALSYLSGPMTREQIKRLNKINALPQTQVQPSIADVPARPTASSKPVLPQNIEDYYVPASGAGKHLIYHPAVFAHIGIHYTGSRYKVNVTREFGLAAELEEGPVPLDWDQCADLALAPVDLQADPLPDARFADLPTAALKTASYKKWRTELKLWLRHNQPLTLFRSAEMKLVSRPDESEADFRFRLTQAMREKRDLDVEKLRQKYDKRFTTLKDRLMRAEQKIDKEQEQVKSRKMDTVVSFGTAILGAFMGRKVVSSTSASKMGTAMKSAGRMQKEKMDVVRAQEQSQAVQQQLADLEVRFQEDLDKLEGIIRCG